MSRTASKSKRKRTGLPAFLKPLFWEYHFGRLNWRKDKHLVTAKVLARGNWRSIQWLRRKWGDEALRDWIIEGHGRGLSRQQVRFWELIYDIPGKQVTAWLADPARKAWDGRLHPR
jgi:hypothetical protein